MRGEDSQVIVSAILMGGCTMLRTILELLRVVLILLIFGSVFYTGMTWGYSWTSPSGMISRGLVLLAILIFILIIYRNRLQFNGFYRGKRTRLSQKATTWLISIAVLLVIVAMLFH